MSNIKVIRNHLAGNSDVVFSAVLRWLGGIVAVVVAGTILAGVVGVFKLGFATQANTQAIENVTTELHTLAVLTSAEAERSRTKDEELRMSQEVIKRRLSAIDKKVE